MVSFWILTHARSGSTYLCDLLNSTKQLPHIGELLHPVRIRSKKSFIKRKPIVAKVLREHFEHIFTNKDKTIIKKTLPDLKFILLKRHEIEKVAVSCYISKQLNVWGILRLNIERGKEKIKNVTTEDYLNMPIKVDESELLKTYEICKNEYTAWNKFLKGEEHLEIDFNELIKNPEQVVKEVFLFLDIEEEPKIEFDNLEYIYPFPKHPQKEQLLSILNERIEG